MLLTTQDYCVKMFLKSDSFSQLWPIWWNMTLFAHCDSYLYENFNTHTHVFKVWLIFPSLILLPKCEAFCACDSYFKLQEFWCVTHVYKEWLILPSLTHLAKSDPFCPVWIIVPSATFLKRLTHVFKGWLILWTLTHLVIWPFQSDCAKWIAFDKMSEFREN